MTIYKNLKFVVKHKTDSSYCYYFPRYNFLKNAIMPFLEDIIINIIVITIIKKKFIIKDKNIRQSQAIQL
jgi:hypothetical protein